MVRQYTDIDLLDDKFVVGVSCENKEGERFIKCRYVGYDLYIDSKIRNDICGLGKTFRAAMLDYIQQLSMYYIEYDFRFVQSMPSIVPMAR